MIELIDGKGQLGSALNKIIEKYNCYGCAIYHTWNIDDSTEDIQKEEYAKFKEYVNENKDKRIIFISTKQGKCYSYLKYKLKAELYLLTNVPNGQIIRIPKIIGKGICEGFKHDKLKPYDELEEIIDVDKLSYEILESLASNDKIIIIFGELLNKQTIYNLIRFGVGL